jgi:hypothetical protein
MAPGCRLGAVLRNGAPTVRLVRPDGVSALRERLDQIGLFGGYFLVTLLYSPLWGFPAILAAVPVRAILLSNGLFGWASALIAGAIAGLAIPLMLGERLRLEGPLYGAVYLWVHTLFTARVIPPRSTSDHTAPSGRDGDQTQKLTRAARPRRGPCRVW